MPVLAFIAPQGPPAPRRSHGRVSTPVGPGISGRAASQMIGKRFRGRSSDQTAKAASRYTACNWATLRLAIVQDPLMKAVDAVKQNAASWVPTRCWPRCGLMVRRPGAE